ncbi:MAG: type II toxin-antitoxin system RelE/ParE family toxin [Desulfobacteraceae bacterium]|nr:type II toxin-antitoxin system RelE/ParE family toxin [Desulfobacteraceae bacterium]
MINKTSYHPQAEAELKEAALYLNHESKDLGILFLNDIDFSMQQIKENPESAPIIKNNVRRKLLSKFPYSIFYIIRKDQIRILAVAHQKRRPFYWHSRQ